MGRNNERTIYMTRHSTELLHAVVERNSAKASQAMDSIASRYGGMGVLMACRFAAEVARKVAFPEFERGDGSLRGPIMTIQKNPQVDIDPDLVWAAQFFAAHCNGDDNTLGALYMASYADPKTHSEQVCALLKMCGSVIRGEP